MTRQLFWAQFCKNQSILRGVMASRLDQGQWFFWWFFNFCPKISKIRRPWKIQKVTLTSKLLRINFLCNPWHPSQIWGQSDPTCLKWNFSWFLDFTCIWKKQWLGSSLKTITPFKMLGFLQNWAQNDRLVKSKLVCWQIFTSLQRYYPKIKDLPEKKSMTWV